MNDGEARRFDARAVDFERRVEIERDSAAALGDRQPLAFEHAEIRDIAQIIALPGIAIDENRVEAARFHRLVEPRSAIIRDHCLLAASK